MTLLALATDPGSPSGASIVGLLWTVGFPIFLFAAAIALTWVAWRIQRTKKR